MDADEAKKNLNAAFDELITSLQKARDAIDQPELMPAPANPRNLAEGYRYLIRLISAAHQLELEADRRRPTLSRMMLPIRKFKGDGCDTLYHEAKVDENLEYRFEVTRGDGTTFSFTALCRIDTANEMEYYRNGGILHYVLRKLAAA